MLQRVRVGKANLAMHTAIVGDTALEELRELARPLAGAKVLHLSATPYGGGVAELLRSQIPLLQALGITAEWRLITGDDRFFQVTKAIHNALQGAPHSLTAGDEETYLAYSARNAALLELEHDLVVVHDPQPLAIPALRDGGTTRWVWRCHIDTSEPHPPVWNFLRPLVERYDAAVFTLGGFVPPGFPIPVEIIPPAIDPTSPKNIDLGDALARDVLRWIGIEIGRPLITQVSRFDAWKDPLGVIAAFRIARQEVPDLQLALVGSMALDDPEGWEMYRNIDAEAAGDESISLFTNLSGVGNVEVNAFQRLSDVTVQKSLREGFGLVVSESLWKRTPVVAGRAGGIPLQLQDGVGGYLVDSPEQCGQRLIEVLTDDELRRTLGAAGHEAVHRRFLLSRLIADELRLYQSVLTRHETAPAQATEAHRHRTRHRDPVCGLRLDGRGPTLEFEGRAYVFCSGTCAAQFSADPERFARSARAGT